MQTNPRQRNIKCQEKSHGVAMQRTPRCDISLAGCGYELVLTDHVSLLLVGRDGREGSEKGG